MIRKAKQTDAKQMAPLIMVIWRDMELAILEKYPQTLLQKVLEEAICTETYRFSYRNTLVYEIDGKIAGILCGYRGELEPVIDEPWKEIGSKYGLTKEDKVFVDRETFAGEWYIDSIVTAPEYRGRQIGTKLLEAASRLAQEAGETVLGLNCDEGNEQARKLYERMGFVPMMKMQLSDHMYDHMQKSIKGSISQ